MSNDQHSSQDIHTDPPAWAAALLERITALESQPRAGPYNPSSSTNDDPFISRRAPDTKFTRYPEFQQVLPGLTKDFLKNPLPEMDRKRFLANCARNVAREYRPPVLNNINISQAAKRFDNRLSEITRPLDYFLHKTLHSGSPSQQDAIEFVNVVYELLLNTASYITKLRADNMI
ncbi:hypothetical protein DFQ28_009284 [Apophysomyces sp. BC1034]|nr:hypothetical protein DFQ30_001366 [Apophysomyces sp. BC1015]KAG0167262.1 hypothetical protein DFQ29_000542 [Apophysomyces sp. BC1021]KAG0185457.1 hypothetical protein DFQ28_009284 [Apophysomyces sp. BC1034]